MDPNVGQLANNKYRLVRLIGDGGMGSVFEARHELLGTTVALKFLHTALARRKGLVDRFLQEAQVSARIRSPHVVRVTDVERTPEGLAYMVMEYVEGSTLQELYEQLYRMGKRLTYGEAFELMFQLMEGVSIAHSMEIVHRDLKPDNVMLTKDGSNQNLVKILDFGIAKLRASGEIDRGLTKPGVVMGTPEYMAPEQAFSADKVDARADIFSLGVMFYEMLAGRRPVGGENAMAIAAQYLEGNVTQLRTLVPTIAPALARAVHRAMAPRPEQRFSTVAELRDAIAPFAPEGPSASAGPPQLTSSRSAEPASGALNLALGAQRSVPRTAPGSDPGARSPAQGVAHTPAGPPILGGGGIDWVDAPAVRPGIDINGADGRSADASDAGSAAEKPTPDPESSSRAERVAASDPTGEADGSSQDGRGADAAGLGGSAAALGDATADPVVEVRGPVDPGAGVAPATADRYPSPGKIDATVALAPGFGGMPDAAPVASGATAAATPFVGMSGAEGSPVPPDAPLPADAPADRPGATVVGAPFDGSAFPAESGFDASQRTPDGSLGTGTQAGPFVLGRGGVPGADHRAAPAEFGASAAVPFEGPIPAPGAPKAKRGPSLLSVLLLAAAVSALVVGGVYAAQEYAKGQDEHRGTREPPVPTTTTSTVPTETTTSSTGATTSTFTTSSTTTTWTQPTTTRTPTPTTSNTYTSPTTSPTTTTTTTTSTRPVWTIPTALPTVPLPFPFPTTRPTITQTSPPPQPTTAPTGTITRTRRPVLRLPVPAPTNTGGP